jgi:hypothetical protein
MRWTAKVRGHDIAVESEQLQAFKDMYVHDDLASRMSDLLLFDMYVLDIGFGVSPHDVLKSIKNLEEGEPHSGIKPATMFRKPPLKGMWHKHYFSAQFLLQNISLALGKDGLEKLITEVFDPSKPVITEEMIEEVARRATMEQVEKRDADGKITGEWVIFAKHDGKNYYLALNTHGAGDQFIYDRITEHCPKTSPNWGLGWRRVLPASERA